VPKYMVPRAMCPACEGEWVCVIRLLNNLKRAPGQAIAVLMEEVAAAP